MTMKRLDFVLGLVMLAGCGGQAGQAGMLTPARADDGALARTCTVSNSDGTSRDVAVVLAGTPVVFPGPDGHTATIARTDTTDVRALAAGARGADTGAYVFLRLSDGVAPASVLLTNVDAGHFTLPTWQGGQVACHVASEVNRTVGVPYGCAARQVEQGHTVHSVSMSVADGDAWTEQHAGVYYGMWNNDAHELSMELSNTFYTRTVNPAFAAGVSEAKTLAFVPADPGDVGFPARPALYLEGECTRLPSSGGTTLVFGPSRAIDGSAADTTSTAQLGAAWQTFAVRRAQIVLKVRAAQPAQLELLLEHAGQSVPVAVRANASGGTDLYDTVELPAFVGADASGDWTLHMRDRSGVGGTLEGFTLLLERPDPGATSPLALAATPQARIPSDRDVVSSLVVPPAVVVSDARIEVTVAKTPTNTLEIALDNGRQSVQLSYEGGESRLFDQFPLHNVAGLDLTGTWTLHVRDSLTGRAGQLISWRLLLNGAK
jgi:subtilisin-like proprotein convertase family protein